jgi:hypothetical protein
VNWPLFGLGVGVIAAGILLLRWRQPIFWVDDQTNVRWTRWWGVHVDQPKRRTVLWLAVCLFLILFGLLLSLDAFLPLQRTDGQWH